MKGDPGPALPGLPPSPQGLALVGQVDMRQMGQASSARARVEDEVRGHCLRRKSAAQAKRTWEGGPRWEGISCPQASVLASLSASFPLLLPPAPTSWPPLLLFLPTVPTAPLAHCLEKDAPTPLAKARHNHLKPH